MPRREPNAATASPAAHAADAASRASGSQRLGGQARLATRRQGGLALVAAPLLDARRRARHCGHAAARQDRRPDPRQHTSVATPMAMACLGSASGGATARRTDGAARPSSRAAGRRIALRAHLRVPRKLSTTIRRIGTAPTSPGPVTERQPNHCQAQRLYLWRGPTLLRGLLLSPNSQAAGRAGAALDLPSVEGRIALSQLCERRQLARCSNRASGESFLAKRSGRGRKLAISSRLRHVTLGPKSILLHATGRQYGTARRFSGLLWSKGLLPIYQTAGGISGNLVHARKGVQPGNEQPLAPDSMCAICRRISALYQKQEAISDDGFASSSQLPGYEQDTTTYLRYHVYLRTRRERVE
mmetsp:Transcript_16802/g.54549  ORF Transcript_16802/g.54549 Transcript_16802/m.54549 type:complete len:357 (-) Transcript_16802:256-1326(-)